MYKLKHLGITEHEASQFSRLPAGWAIGRIVGKYHHEYSVIHGTAMESDALESRAKITGAFEYQVVESSDYPVTGDWVLLSDEGRSIQELITRRTCLSRTSSGSRGDQQVLAANVDTILFLFALDGYRNFSVGLLERMQTMSAACGAQAVIVLNKLDIADPELIEKTLSMCRLTAEDVPLFMISAQSGAGMDELKNALEPGRTYCCIGRSGVGKSSLVNRLCESEIQQVSGVSRIENKGRHTTSSSRLLCLPGAALMIDTPGLRELQLWADLDDLDYSFPEITELSVSCRFRDCKHSGEPGCAVQQALSLGELPVSRYEKYLEQRDELSSLQERQNMSAARYERKKWKPIAVSQRKKT
ncbi:ribosome small subunit-dependent GTPase A [Spirochaeta dissipatitropha]